MKVAHLSIAAVLLAQLPAPAQKPSLDYSVFKEQVQPILLKKRPGHARCITCHKIGRAHV